MVFATQGFSMSGSILSPQLLLSPSSESEAILVRMLRSQSFFFGHAVTCATICLFLVLLNILIDGLATPWSLFPLVAWGILLASHGLVWNGLGNGHL